MKIAYDIAVLGQGYTNPKARTGIYRVVESLLIELLKQPSIDLLPVALTDKDAIWNDMSTQLYWEKFFPSSRIPYCTSYTSSLPPEAFQAAIQTQRYLLHTVAAKHRFLYQLSLAIKLPFRRLGKLDHHKFIQLSEIDIFHSPFNAFPDLDIVQDKPRVLTIYDLIPILDKDKFTSTIYNKFLATIASLNLSRDFIIAISQSTKNDLCNHLNIDSDRVFVTPLAASDDFYPVSNRSLIEKILRRHKIPCTPYFLSLCTLEPRKNLAFLVAAFLELIQAQPELDINLVLVGTKGWKNQDLFGFLAKHPHLRHRVVLAGYVPDSDLSAVYSGALAFVYPSIYEGFGLPPLEAMKCGIPVITSNTSSMPEVVGDAGIMIDPVDRSGLCQAMLDLLVDNSLHRKLSQKSLDRATRFSWSTCAQQTVDVYNIAASIR